MTSWLGGIKSDFWSLNLKCEMERVKMLGRKLFGKIETLPQALW